MLQTAWHIQVSCLHCINEYLLTIKQDLTRSSAHVRTSLMLYPPRTFSPTSTYVRPAHAHMLASALTVTRSCHPMLRPRMRQDASSSSHMHSRITSVRRSCHALRCICTPTCFAGTNWPSHTSNHFHRPGARSVHPCSPQHQPAQYASNSFNSELVACATSPRVRIIVVST